MAGTIRIAAALIDDGQGRVFLVRKRGTRVFMQAGGKIDPGETPIQALLRELEEELGFSPGADQPRYLGDFTAKAANEPGRLLKASLFHIRAARDFDIAAELEEAMWVPLDTAAGLDLAPFTRDQVLPIARQLLA
jgi:8-oxo-dGTP pyrophosphatase MutT (NUDIX family)